MSLSRQISNLTKELPGGYTHTLRYTFFARVAWIVVALIALIAVTICTYQGTENLMYWVNQWSI